MKVTGTFDIECGSWDRFVCATSYCECHGSKEFDSIADLSSHMLAHPGSAWWAHAGGVYDSLAIAEEFRRREIQTTIDLSNSRISRMVAGGIVIRDSWPLIPLDMTDVAGLVSLSPPTLGIPCRCNRGCGGYCSIGDRRYRATVVEYCAQDSKILFLALRKLVEIAAELELDLRGTLGGTAWATARRVIGLPDAEYPIPVWREMREAYYGGRVTIGRPRVPGRGEHFDISSAYPWALSVASLPVGKFARVADSDARLALARGEPGLFYVDATIPDMHLPPLPVRLGNRICYPIGKVRGMWSAPEIESATDRGVSIDRVHWGFVWEREKQLFQSLIGKWWRARAKAGKDTPLGKWLRLLPNSITGKLSESPDRRAAKMFPETIKVCSCGVECRGCGAYEQLDLWGQIWSVPFTRPATSSHVAWAAYLTAICRGRWLAGCESVGNDFVYGDTDSLWTIGNDVPQPYGADLGQWEHKHSFTNFECVAPRTYRFEQDRKSIVRASGVQLSNSDWESGSGNRDQGVLSFIEASASSRGLFRRRHQSWTLPQNDDGWYGDRVITSDGTTRPVTYGEIKARYEQKARQRIS